MPDAPHRPPLDVAGVRRDLVGPGRPVRRLDVVESTGSTNADLLARHAAGEDIGGAVLIAEHQSAGRGRQGRYWSTPARSQIALSVGVDAAGRSPSDWGWLPLLAGVAVADAVRATTGISPGLKWPNDLLVGERKLGGILAEVASPAPIVVVGLGVNVTLTAAEIEHEAPNATSLLMLGSTMLDRSALLGSILAELSARIDRWRAIGPDAALIDDYRSRSTTLGTRVRAMLPGDREIIGTATDLDALGQLHIDTGGGSEATRGIDAGGRSEATRGIDTGGRSEATRGIDTGGRSEATRGIDDGAQTIAVSAGDITHLRPE